MRPTVGVLSDFTVAPGAFAAARASRVDLACPRGLRPTSRSMLPRSTSPTTTSLVEARASGGRSPCGSACAIRPRRRRSVMRLLVAVPRLTSSRTIGSCLRVEVRLKLGRARLPSWAATRGCHAQLRRRRRHELKLVPRVGALATRGTSFNHDNARRTMAALSGQARSPSRWRRLDPQGESAHRELQPHATPFDERQSLLHPARARARSPSAAAR